MKKVFLIGCGGLFLLFVISLIIGTIYAFQNPDELGATPNGKLAKELEITADEATPILEVFKTIGIEDYTSIEHDELLDNAHMEGEKGYRLNTREASNIIVYLKSDSTLNMVRYADADLYSENAVKAHINDYTLSNSEMSNLQIQSQKAIESILKSPSTAEFPNILEWKFKKEDGIITIQSYVDAQNGFGAMIRSEFQLKVKDDKVISLIMDGKEYIQQ